MTEHAELVSLVGLASLCTGVEPAREARGGVIPDEDGEHNDTELHLLLYDYHMLGYCVCTHLGERTAREWDLLMTTEPGPAFHPTRSVSLTPTSTLVLLLLITRSPDSTFVRIFNPQGQAKIYMLDHLYKHHYSPTLRSVATAKYYRI